MQKFGKPLFIILALLCLAPFASPPLALFAGLIFAFAFGNPFPAQSAKYSRLLLQYSVIGLGFGMNLYESLQAGKEGIIFTIISVFGVLALGVYLSRKMKVESKIGYLISAGTAICGGSAIAAVAPIVKAESKDISISIGTVFILNAIALFIFPHIGHLFGLSQQDFGLWAAIAIHDTSSVVGAGSVYGPEALQVATTVKLTRALWIIPLALLTSFLFKSKTEKMYKPWFILFFILAMLANTFLNIPSDVSHWILYAARKGLTLTLFLIGAGLSPAALKAVGSRPLLLGIVLWICISVFSLAVIMSVS